MQSKNIFILVNIFMRHIAAHDYSEPIELMVQFHNMSKYTCFIEYKKELYRIGPPHEGPLENMRSIPMLFETDINKPAPYFTLALFGHDEGKQKLTYIAFPKPKMWILKVADKIGEPFKPSYLPAIFITTIPDSFFPIQLYRKDEDRINYLISFSEK